MPDLIAPMPAARRRRYFSDLYDQLPDWLTGADVRPYQGPPYIAPPGKAGSYRMEVANDLARRLSDDPRTQRNIASTASGALDFVPFVGDALTVHETGEAYDRGDYLGMGIGGAAVLAGLVPGLGDVASGLLKKLRPAKKGLGALPPPAVTDKVIHAYHGSPFDFAAEPGFPLGRFRKEHMGTGQGIQAYGKGTYVAEKEAVAKDYRDMLSKAYPSKIRLPGGEEVLASKSTPAQSLAAGAVQWEKDAAAAGSPKTALEMLDNLMPKPGVPDFKLYTPEVIEEAKQLVRQGIEYKLPGKMYEVNIHADPESFLNWDVPVGQQTPQVKRSLAQIPWAEDYLKSQNLPGGNIVPQTEIGTEEFVKAGIPGVKYFDQGSRVTPADLPWLRKELADYESWVAGGNRSESLKASIADLKKKIADYEAGQGTRNYVVFDPGLIEIVKKYGIAAALASGLITEEMARQMQQQGEI